MKVGTDGVLLGAWCDPGKAKRILDIGTGSGVIALMLAQRTAADVHIDAVEIDPEDAAQASENVSTSPWPEKIVVHNIPAQEFSAPSSYDLLVSNPPYFNNSQKPPAERRIQTRHTTTLSYEMLLTTADKLLSQDGRLNLILPNNEGLGFIELAATFNFQNTRKYSFRTRKEKPVERWLLEFSRKEKQTDEGEILLYRQDLIWSDEYIELTRDFYLKF